MIVFFCASYTICTLFEARTASVVNGLKKDFIFVSFSGEKLSESREKTPKVYVNWGELCHI
jgi:hypothetical protein